MSGRGRACLCAAPGLVVALAACRGVIGYSPLTYSADAGVDASCPSVKPTPLFTTMQPVTSLFFGGKYVYAEVGNLFVTDAAFSGPYTGLLACPAAGCEGKAETLVNLVTMPDGATWASATSTPAALYYALQRGGHDASGVIETANPDGGAVETVVRDLAYPLLLAADSDTVYWTNDPATSTFGAILTPWSVMAAPVGQGRTEPSVLFRGFGSAGTYGIFVDSQNVYALAGDMEGNAGLFVCPLLTRGGCNGAASELVSGIAFSNDDYPVETFAADGQYVYEADMVTGRISRIDFTTHVATTLATGQLGPSGIVVAGDDIYWTTQTGLVVHMPRDGSSAPVPLLCGSEAVVVAADGQRLYLIAAKGSSIEVATVPIP